MPGSRPNVSGTTTRRKRREQEPRSNPPTPRDTITPRLPSTTPQMTFLFVCVCPTQSDKQEQAARNRNATYVGLLELEMAPDAGVENQNVDRAKGLHRPAHQVGAVILLGHVGPDTQHLTGGAPVLMARPKAEKKKPVKTKPRGQLIYCATTITSTATIPRRIPDTPSRRGWQRRRLKSQFPTPRFRTAPPPSPHRPTNRTETGGQ